MTLAVVAAGAVAALIPAAATVLQYDRFQVAGGEVWRLLTGQMVHWTPRMAAVDLASILALGAWLESRGRRRALLWALGLAAILGALGIGFSRLAVYRGSSGLASALFVLAAAQIARRPLHRWERPAAGLALLLFLGKAVWEIATGRALAAGALPPGVAVTPLVHVLGGVAGAIAAGLDGCREIFKTLQPMLDRRGGRVYSMFAAGAKNGSTAYQRTHNRGPGRSGSFVFSGDNEQKERKENESDRPSEVVQRQ